MDKRSKGVDQFKNYEERGNEFKRLVNEMAQA